MTGLAVATLDVANPGSAPSIVPGTEFASGVCAGDSPDLIYFTRGGDTRVFRARYDDGSDRP